MATSGLYTLGLTTNDLIDQSYDLLQIGQQGETLTGDFYNRATRTLNVMLKTWEAQGIHLWTMEEGTLFLAIGQSEYPFSTSKVANTYYETTTDAAEAIGQTVISVTSTSNMVVGQIIGLVDEDNDLFWSTISSFVTDTTVTIANALTTAVPSGNEVYFYSNTFKPCNRVLSVRRKEGTTYEVPINFISRDEYMSLPNKSTQGYPIQAYYDRKETTGTMFLWNAPSSAVPVIRFTYERKMQILDASTNTFDLPEYWFEAIIWNLAKRLIPIYGCDASRKLDIKEMAKDTLDDALGFDTDVYPIKVMMGNN